jgi:hypothetical protein
MKNHPQIKEETGHKYGRLTVQSFACVKHRKAYWNCLCECGEKVTVIGTSLRNGGTKSCTCFRIDETVRRSIKHLHSIAGAKTKAYTTWSNVKSRCTNPKSSHFEHYGRRGIKMCARWIDSFENFLEDMGDRPPGMTIERINNDGDYEPGNCRWASHKEQMNNTRGNRFLTFNGITKTISQWAISIGLHPNGLAKRLERGWTLQLALTTPKTH